MNDDVAMAEALAEGERGRLTAAPNPWVGCVVVSGGEIVGRGFHRAAGEAHAEPVALAAAGDRARGSTAYVTLEPCSHQGRTPPCAPALVDAGVARVVVAVLDPDPNVSGRGVEMLRHAGLTVEVGVGAVEAAASLAPYLHQRLTGRAYCLLKSAVSLDGRTAAADGSSQWITGPAARADAHRLRAESQAVMVGSGTALADLPALTARDVDPPAPRQPLRVLLDARGRVAATGPLFDVSLAPTLVITSPDADRVVVDAWKSAGAEVAHLARAAGGGVDLGATLALLGERGILQVMVEGGAPLHGALIREGFADRLVLYVGGCLLGESGRPLAGGRWAPSITDAPRWAILSARTIGADVRIDCVPAA